MGRLVPAVTRALDILELFLDGDEALTAPEITRKLGLPRTTVHELVTTLAARHYLTQRPEAPGQYRLGVRGYQVGSRYAEQLDLASEGRSVAELVSRACDETVHVGILEGRDVIYIAKVDSSHAVRMVSAPGRRLPAHLTSDGKILLACLPDHELDARFAELGALDAMTPDSVATPGQLRRELAEIRRRGIAVEKHEVHAYVACVAAPVRDVTGQVVAALSIAVPTVRWSEERRPELERMVREGADELSARLGYRESPRAADR